MTAIPMTVSVTEASVQMRVNSPPEVPLQIGVDFKTVDVDVYDGEMEFTPAEQAQVIRIRDKMALDDITIKPIPGNYGLITWNGAFLTVS